jgi:hypothetical protein
MKARFTPGPRFIRAHSSVARPPWNSVGEGLTLSDICGEMASVTNVIGLGALASMIAGRERVDVAG